ncbi:MAG: T9SS type A sorting domain-containing protein [Marinilabiliaceae bacterium]|nr:T9SS type A sorting domain-containing protein [Marinilabiliaceae bacterium]
MIRKLFSLFSVIFLITSSLIISQDFTQNKLRSEISGMMYATQFDYPDDPGIFVTPLGVPGGGIKLSEVTTDFRALEYVNGVVYAIDCNEDTYICRFGTINPITCAFTIINGNFPYDANGLAWNPITQEMFVSTWDKRFGKINLNNGTFSQIGMFNEIVTIAIDNNGICYAQEVTNMVGAGFGTVNLNTGVFTQISGSFEPYNYVFNMSIDRETNELYIQPGIPSYYPFYRIDKTSGAFTLIGTCTQRYQSFCIMTTIPNPDVPESVTNLSITQSHNTAHISWTNPSFNYGGNPLAELTSVIVYENSNPIPIYTNNSPEIGENGYFSVSYTNPDRYTYTIVAINSVGESPAATISHEYCTTIDTFPYSESFEHNGTNLPACWSQEFVAGSSSWKIVPSSGGKPYTVQGGVFKARLYGELLEQGDITKLIMPPIDLSGGGNPTLKFWHTQMEWWGSQDILKVFYKTSLNSNWILLAEYSNNVADWTERVIGLPNGTADYYIAFEGTIDYARGIQLDGITIEGESIQKYTVAVSSNPIGAGIVLGGGTYFYAEEATVIAIPNDGYSFINWTVDNDEVSTDEEYTFPVMQDIHLVANFDISGIKSSGLFDSFKIFPNPVSDKLNIISPISEKFDIEIITTTGLLIMSSETNNTEIDVSKLPSGVYFVKIFSKFDNKFFSSENDIIVLKFVKK